MFFLFVASQRFVPEMKQVFNNRPTDLSVKTLRFSLSLDISFDETREAERELWR